MTNRSAFLSVAEETNKKNGAVEYVAIVKEPCVVQNFRSPNRDEALKLAHEYALKRALNLISMDSVLRPT